MGFSVRHLRDALDRPLPPAPWTPGRAQQSLRRPSYPYREPPPIWWFYRADPLVQTGIIAAIIVPAIVLLAWVTS